MQYKLLFRMPDEKLTRKLLYSKGCKQRRPTAHSKYCAGLPQQGSNSISQRDSLQFQILIAQHGPDVTLE